VHVVVDYVNSHELFKMNLSRAMKVHAKELLLRQEEYSRNIERCISSSVVKVKTVASARIQHDCRYDQRLHNTIT
jgi:hypothetical protein